MTNRISRLVIAVVYIAATSMAGAETTLIHAGQLLAVPGERPASEQTIVVDGQRIVAVINGFADASAYGEDTRIVDLSDQFVLPGLMDMHVHLQGELGPNNEKEQLEMSSQLMQMRSIHFAMKTLLAGFTTVRDVGSSGQEMFAMRDAINMGWIDGPRIIAAGGVGITGGHADISGVKPELMELAARRATPSSMART
jgi:imidazolonepropionase-like amidohydrolase